MFVGYFIPYHAYLRLDHFTKKLFTSRYVIFVENTFPFHNHSSYHKLTHILPFLDVWLLDPHPEPSSLSNSICLFDTTPYHSLLVSNTQNITNLPISPTP